MVNNWLEVPEVPQFWVGELSIDIPKGYTLIYSKDSSEEQSVTESPAVFSETGNYSFQYQIGKCDTRSKNVTCYITAVSKPTIVFYQEADTYYCNITCETDLPGDIYYQVDDGRETLYKTPFILGKQGAEEKTGTVKARFVYGKFSESESANYTIEKYKLGAVTISPSSSAFSTPQTITFTGDGDIYYKLNNSIETLYTEPIVITKDTSITYWNTKNGVKANPETAEYFYLPYPTISPDVKTISASDTISITGWRGADNFQIFNQYSINGGEYINYEAPFTIKDTTIKDVTIKAVSTCIKNNTKLGEVSTERSYKIVTDTNEIVVSEEDTIFREVNYITGYLHTATIKAKEGSTIEYRLYREGEDVAFSNYTEKIPLRADDAATHFYLEVKVGDKSRILEFFITKEKMPKVELYPDELTIENVYPNVNNIEVRFVNIPVGITFKVTYKWEEELYEHTINGRIIPLQEGTVTAYLSSDYYEGNSNKVSGTYKYILKAPTFNPGYQDAVNYPYLGQTFTIGLGKTYTVTIDGMGNTQYSYTFCNRTDLQETLDTDVTLLTWTQGNEVSWNSWQAAYIVIWAKSDSEVSKIYYSYIDDTPPSPSNNIPEPEVFPASGEFSEPITCVMLGDYIIKYDTGVTYSEPINISESTTITAWQESQGKTSNKVVRNYTIKN